MRPPATWTVTPFHDPEGRLDPHRRYDRIPRAGVRIDRGLASGRLDEVELDPDRMVELAELLLVAARRQRTALRRIEEGRP